MDRKLRRDRNTSAERQHRYRSRSRSPATHRHNRSSGVARDDPLPSRKQSSRRSPPHRDVGSRSRDAQAAVGQGNSYDHRAPFMVQRGSLKRSRTPSPVRGGSRGGSYYHPGSIVAPRVLDAHAGHPAPPLRGRSRSPVGRLSASGMSLPPGFRREASHPRFLWPEAAVARPGPPRRNPPPLPPQMPAAGPVPLHREPLRSRSPRRRSPLQPPPAEYFGSGRKRMQERAPLLQPVGRRGAQLGPPVSPQPLHAPLQITLRFDDQPPPRHRSPPRRHSHPLPRGMHPPLFVEPMLPPMRGRSPPPPLQGPPLFPPGFRGRSPSPPWRRDPRGPPLPLLPPEFRPGPGMRGPPGPHRRRSLSPGPAPRFVAGPGPLPWLHPRQGVREIGLERRSKRREKQSLVDRRRTGEEEARHKSSRERGHRHGGGRGKEAAEKDRKPVSGQEKREGMDAEENVEESGSSGVVYESDDGVDVEEELLGGVDDDEGLQDGDREGRHESHNGGPSLVTSPAGQGEGGEDRGTSKGQRAQGAATEAKKQQQVLGSREEAPKDEAGGLACSGGPQEAKLRQLARDQEGEGRCRQRSQKSQHSNLEVTGSDGQGRKRLRNTNGKGKQQDGSRKVAANHREQAAHEDGQASVRGGEQRAQQQGGKSERTHSLRQTADDATPEQEPSPVCKQEREALPVGTLASAELRALVTDAKQQCWYYRDPQGSTQGPHSTSQLQKWMDFLTHSQDPEHKQACAEFRSVAVYKKGMAMKVLLADLLEALASG